MIPSTELVAMAVKQSRQTHSLKVNEQSRLHVGEEKKEVSGSDLSHSSMSEVRERMKDE